jgi:Sec-independent protein translocase protein TatA
MSLPELLVITILCIILLKPKDIEIITKNILSIITKINKIIHEIKNNLIKQ